ncbi:MAG: SoxR reducing system RseC family protein [Bacteroidales bacterium]|nr:SoxR reducing system RseC family protein [Bacteroidales bacterium]
MSNGNNCIIHEGTVQEIDHDMVKVSIEQTGGCGACSAKSLCGGANTSNRTIEAISTGQHFAIGEKVKIEMATRMGLKAVMVGYMVPFS